MTGRDFYEKWAPVGARWVEWVRPVPFVAICETFPANEIYNFAIPKLNYINEMQEDTAIVVDRPSYEGIEEGLALAKLGFRPIPLYNGTEGQDRSMILVDTKGIENCLIWGAFELEKIAITNKASPAFLLDSNRMHRFRMDGSVFDNSWDLYHQDIPSAEYLLEQGINKIIVHGEKMQKDIAKIFHKFQEKGITILFTNGFEAPKPVIVKKERKTDAL